MYPSRPRSRKVRHPAHASSWSGAADERCGWAVWGVRKGLGANGSAREPKRRAGCAQTAIGLAFALGMAARAPPAAPIDTSPPWAGRLVTKTSPRMAALAVYHSAWVLRDGGQTVVKGLGCSAPGVRGRHRECASARWKPAMETP